MERPSSTITAATLAGMGVSVIWELVATFTTVALSPGIIASSVVFTVALAGYFKKENVLSLKDDDE